MKSSVPVRASPASNKSTFCKAGVAAAVVAGFGFRIWLPLLGLVVVPALWEASRWLAEPQKG